MKVEQMLNCEGYDELVLCAGIVKGRLFIPLCNDLNR